MYGLENYVLNNLVDIGCIFHFSPKETFSDGQTEDTIFLDFGLVELKLVKTRTWYWNEISKGG